MTLFVKFSTSLKLKIQPIKNFDWLDFAYLFTDVVYIIHRAGTGPGDEW